MDAAQVRDEALTLFLAGHETTANALAWTWYLLARHPEAEARFHAEVDAVLGDRLPGAQDLPDLPYTRQIFAESMRLYPPAWAVSRRSIEPVTIGGYPVPAGPGSSPPSGSPTAIRASSRTLSPSARSAGRRSSRPGCRSSPTSRSAAAPGSASAWASRGWRGRSCWPRSAAGGGCGSSPATGSSPTRASPCGRRTACG